MINNELDKEEMILAIKACKYQHDIRMPQEGGFECDRHLRAHVDALTLV